MGMTREEAIAEIKYYMESDSYADAPSNEACKMAINALRPVSREQVEKMWTGCEKCRDQANWPSWIEKGFVTAQSAERRLHRGHGKNKWRDWRR